VGIQLLKFDLLDDRKDLVVVLLQFSPVHVVTSGEAGRLCPGFGPKVKLGI
jgi:hypothetical protein